MSTFRYKAVRPSGEVIEGDLQASDSQAALGQIADMGLFPIRTDQLGGRSLSAVLKADISVFGGGVNGRDVMIVTRELATLLEAGVEVERALELIVTLSEKSAIAALFGDVLDDVRGGASLSDALDRHGRHFPQSYVGMVRAGESGGALAVVFVRIADFLERAQKVRENLHSALIYPTILLLMAVVAVAVMVTVVLPQFEPLFANSGKELPWLTRIENFLTKTGPDSWKQVRFEALPNAPSADGRVFRLHQRHGLAACADFMSAAGTLFGSVLSQLGLDPPFGRLVTQLHAQLPVDPVRLLQIDRPTFPPKQDVYAPIAKAHAGLANLSDPLFKSGLTGPTRLVSVGLRIKQDHRAGAADRN